jgi:hypothetical protein
VTIPSTASTKRWRGNDGERLRVDRHDVGGATPCSVRHGSGPQRCHGVRASRTADHGERATPREHLEEEAVHEAWVPTHDASEATRPARVTLSDEGEDRVHEPTPRHGTGSRQSRYDPENLFHRNQNIPPAYQ